MTTTRLLVLLVVVVLLALVAVAVLAAARRRKRSAELQRTFGPEYDRTVEGAGGRKDAERDLIDRQQRHGQLQIRPLSEASRVRYLTAWDGVQNRFIDSPVLALSEADALVTQMMSERGFPTTDARSAEEMLSVEHAHVLADFRAGHDLEQANSSQRANTEQVRQGMLHFRSVFEELVSEGRGDTAGAAGGAQPGRVGDAGYAPDEPTRDPAHDRTRGDGR